MIKRIKEWHKARVLARRTKSLVLAQKLARAGVIEVPASFKNATIKDLLDVCNGCGAKGSRFRPPPRILFTLVEPACQVHDWMWQEGNIFEDKQEADRTFQNNMNRLFARDAHKWYTPTLLQSFIGLFYYAGVVFFGGPAFWHGKN